MSDTILAAWITAVAAVIAPILTFLFSNGRTGRTVSWIVGILALIVILKPYINLNLPFFARFAHKKGRRGGSIFGL